MRQINLPFHLNIHCRHAEQKNVSGAFVSYSLFSELPQCLCIQEMYYSEVVQHETSKGMSSWK